MSNKQHATVEEFDDDTEFDLPAVPRPPPPSNPVYGASSSAAASDPLASMFANVDPAQLEAMRSQFAHMGMGAMGGLGGGPMAAADDEDEGDDDGLQLKGAKEVQDDSSFKHWSSIYPAYIDAKRSCANTGGNGGRKIAYEKAVLWPRSRDMAEEARRLGVGVAHEPGKTHPQDWTNPGRIKVRLFDEEKRPLTRFRSKKQLLEAIAAALQQAHGGPPPLLKQPVKAAKKTEPTATKAAKRAASTRRPGPPRRRPIPPLPPSSSLPTTARLPPHSPALQAGLLNMDLKESMGFDPTAMFGGGGAGGPPGGAAGQVEGGQGQQMPKKMKRKVVRIGH